MENFEGFFFLFSFFSSNFLLFNFSGVERNNNVEKTAPKLKIPEREREREQSITNQNANY